MAYLYGASIQGIQGFIFETNKLKEIVGASDLVEWICSLELLNKFCREDSCIKIPINDVLRNAGGNIRIKFEDKNNLEDFVKIFPKIVMQEAYGIVVSQAIVSYDDNNDYLEVVDNLEKKLKSARNKASYPLDAKFALMRQAPRTGKPAYEKRGKELYDKASWQKLGSDAPAWLEMLLYKMGQKDKEYINNFTLDMSEISNNNNKIAIVHADGNKMGLKLQEMKTALMDKSTQDIQNAYKELSAHIVSATNDAIQSAFEEVFEDEINASIRDSSKKIPFRPAIIGGDDITVICHADKAIDFTKKYLEKFEYYTKIYFENLVKKYSLDIFKEGLTACAGIAYCNEKFPFHYAVSLAEELCGRAKKASKREDSCLLFHNIQGAAFVDYDIYVQNELIVDNGTTATHLEYGPYYVRENGKKPYLGDLQDLYDAMTKESFPLGKLREWLSELHYSDEYAKGYLERVKVMVERNSKKDELSHLNHMLKKLGDFSLDKLINENNKTPINDILQLKSVQGGKNV